MAKFYDVIGYVTEDIEVRPGVFEPTMVEHYHFGDVIRNTRQLQGDAKINFDLSVGNSISIVADAYANENFFAMRYLRWMGTLWTVQSVEVERPRLILRLGGVYNGPTAPPPPDPGGPDA